MPLQVKTNGFTIQDRVHCIREMFFETCFLLDQLTSLAMSEEGNTGMIEENLDGFSIFLTFSICNDPS